MRKKKVPSKKDVLQQMIHLAVHPVNDAVRLAYLAEDCAEIGSLDLTGLTEFKRNANGTVEIKFTDRMRVLESLLLHLEEEGNGSTAFLRALGTSQGTGKSANDEWDALFPKTKNSPELVEKRLTVSLLRCHYLRWSGAKR